jgi:hypothetical protein
MRANSSPFGVGTPAPFRFWLGEHTQPRFWASGLPGGGCFSRLRDMEKPLCCAPARVNSGTKPGYVRSLHTPLPGAALDMWSAGGRLAAGDRGQASESMSAMSIAVGRPDGHPTSIGCE